jgi:hypothetical protein
MGASVTSAEGGSTATQDLPPGGSMNLTGVVQELRKERDRTQTELERLDAALAALGSLDGASRVLHRRGRPVSAVARARMVTAQRARRAREREEKPTRSKGPIPIRVRRKISAAGLASIRAAQNARWAKWKKQQKAA